MTAVDSARAVAGTAVNLAAVPLVAVRWTAGLTVEVARVAAVVGGMVVLTVLDIADTLLYGVEYA